MFHVPKPPNTLVTLQIVCVSCNEKFTISVDAPNRPNRGARSSHWHVPTNKFSTTRMRFTQHQHRRPVMPPSLAQPEENPDEGVYRDRRQNYHINCPRCGTDNRNWLNALYKSSKLDKTQWFGAFLVLFIFLLSYVFVFHVGDKRSVYLALSIVLAGWLPLYIIPKMWPNVRIYNYLTDVSPSTRERIPPHWWPGIAILLIFAIGLPLIRFVAFPAIGWIVDEFRPDPGIVERMDTLSQTKKFSQLETLYAEGNQPVVNAYASMTSQLNGNTPNCDLFNIDKQLATLEAARAETPDFYAHAINRIREGVSEIPRACQKMVLGEVLAVLKANGQYGIGAPIPCIANCTSNVVVDAIADLEVLIAELPDESSMSLVNSNTEDGRKEILKKTRQVALNTDPTSEPAQKISDNLDTLEWAIIEAQGGSPPLFDGGFLFAWFVTVFIAWLLGTIWANMALGNRIKMIDPHLPPPIFSNITNMTRLAIWELRRTLELEEYVHQIQWMQAKRDAGGGINLVGLHRGLPEFNALGIPKGEKIRAQRYEITTTPWVKIISADIKDVEVPRTISTPTFVAAQIWPRENGGNGGGENGGNGEDRNNGRNGNHYGNGSIRIRGSQPSGPSDAAAQSQRPSPTSPSMETAVFAQDTIITQEQDTAPLVEATSFVPPPLYFSATAAEGDLVTNSPAGQLTLVQVSHLSRNICHHFNVSELRWLCLDLNIDYDALPGKDKREKANEIIRTFGRRGQTAYLLSALRSKRPHVNWDIVD